MGNVYVHTEYTTINPISCMGYEAGVCWGSDVSSKKKNYKRGKDCLESNHGRVLEFPQVYITLDGYSARVIREFYTHIGGSPTRLQESTRYIDESFFDYVIPKTIQNDDNLLFTYTRTMGDIMSAYKTLISDGVPKEDAANLLPLGMESKVVVRTNLRNLIEMSHQRLCRRAYWEYRELMHDLMDSLSHISEEWSEIVDKYFVPKCEVNDLNKCFEKKGCGRYGKE